MSAFTGSTNDLLTRIPGTTTHERTIPVGEGQVRLASVRWTPPDAGARLILVRDDVSLGTPLLDTLRESLLEAGFEILEVALLRPDECRDRLISYDIPLLARRLEGVGQWTERHGFPRHCVVLGTGNAVAAALWLASKRFSRVRAVVGICGRPHLAEPALGLVGIPTLLLVDKSDARALHMNRIAARRLGKACTLQELASQVPVDRCDWLAGWLKSSAVAASRSGLAARSWISSSLPALSLLRSLISLALFCSLLMVAESAGRSPDGDPPGPGPGQHTRTP